MKRFFLNNITLVMLAVVGAIGYLIVTVLNLKK
jgi:preprotein translocase subunit Sss1